MKYLSPYLFSDTRELFSYKSITFPQAFYDSGSNTGNYAFYYALKQLVDCDMRQEHWQWPSQHATNETGLIPLANQLGSHCDMSTLVPIWENISGYLVGFGLGGQSTIGGEFIQTPLPETTIRWLEIIKKHRASEHPNISVRGEETLKTMRSLGFDDCATVLGCPSLLISQNRRLGQTISNNLKKPKKIVYLPGNASMAGLEEIERRFAKLVLDNNGVFVVQSGPEMIHLATNDFEGMGIETFNKVKLRYFPELEPSQFVHWCTLHSHVFFNTHSWIEFYKDFDFVIGPRIHGTILALQAGIPAICIVIDSRTLELCQTMKIPYIIYNNIPDKLSIDNLPSLLNFDPEEFNANRQILAAKTASFMINNRIKPSRHLLSLI